MSHGCLPVFLLPRQAVADAVDGFDSLGSPQLFAKMLNMNVQRAGVSAAGIAPGVIAALPCEIADAAVLAFRRFPVIEHRAGLLGEKPRHGAQQRCFARAVLAQNPHDLAFGHRKAHAQQTDLPAMLFVGFFEIPDFNHLCFPFRFSGLRRQDRQTGPGFPVSRNRWKSHCSSHVRRRRDWRPICGHCRNPEGITGSQP